MVAQWRDLVLVALRFIVYVGGTNPFRLPEKQNWAKSMKQKRHLLIIGPRAFATTVVAALVELREDVVTMHAPYTSIDLFLTRWRPDCAVVDADDLGHETVVEIEALTRFEARLPIVIVSSHPVDPLVAPAAAAILCPSEVQTQLAPLVRLLVERTSSSSA